nr:hypothetical protein [uncultured Holophaga sp.]
MFRVMCDLPEGTAAFRNLTGDARECFLMTPKVISDPGYANPFYWSPFIVLSPGW